MTINHSAKVGSRRGKGSSKPSSSETAKQTVEEKAGAETLTEADTPEANKEDTMDNENVVEIKARPASKETKQKKGAIELHHSALTDRPVMPDEMEIAGTITEAGIRPIATSNLEIYASYANGRPITASHLRVVELLPGDRPIFASDLKIVDDGFLPGHRPVVASDPKLMEGSYLPGNRPIAPNDIDDPMTLMGFID